MSETRKGLFDWYFKTSLLIRIFIALVLGGICGVFMASIGTDVEWVAKTMAIVKPFGALFIRLLQMIIVPTVAFTLIVGSSSIAPSRLGKVGVKILAFYMIVSVIAAVIGMIMAVIFKPGLGMNLQGADVAGKAAAKVPISDVILNIVPTNFFAALTSGNVLPIIFFCLLLGIALAYIKDSGDERIMGAGKVVFEFFDGMSELMYKVVGWVMQYAPIGVFALMLDVFAKNGAAVAGPLVKVTIVCYIGFIVHYFLVYGSFLTFHGFNYFKFLKKARAPMLTAFVTRSSGGTLPITMANAEKMGVDRGIYSFTLPVGATISMDGTALYQAVCACFIANAVGLPLGIEQMVLVVLVAVLGSLGTAGVPGAGALMLLMVLEAVGLSIEAGSAAAVAYAMILGMDALLDMGRTCLNVAVDVVGTLWVAKSEGELDREKYEAYDGKL